MNVMVDRESRALGELNELTPAPDEPEQEVMGLEDDFFLMDNPSFLGVGLDLVEFDFVGEIGELAPG